MVVVYLAPGGVILFILATVVLGVRLRRTRSPAAAERASRVMHVLFFVCLGAPFLIAVITPGLTRLDPLLGVAPLPFRPLTLALGVLLGLPGLYLMAASNRLLRTAGSGANAIRLTKQLVALDVYRFTRNPMSLGYYLSCLGLSLLVGSTVLTGYVLLGLIPAHLLFLSFFEQRELELRFGEPYREYRRRVPFLLPGKAR